MYFYYRSLGEALTQWPKDFIWNERRFCSMQQIVFLHTLREGMDTWQWNRWKVIEQSEKFERITDNRTIEELMEFYFGEAPL